MAAIDEFSEQLRAAMIACHPLLRQLKEIGNCRPFDGGRTIITELESPMQVQVKSPPSIAWYSGYDPIKFDEPWPASNLHRDFQNNDEAFTAAEFPIRQIGMSPGDDIASSIKDLSTVLAHTISMGGPSNSINSLSGLVSASPTVGIVGGIDRSRWRFWRNLSVKNSGHPVNRDIISLVGSRLAIMERGKAVLPDLILMGEEDFNALSDSIPEDERHGTKYSDWGFKSLDLDGSCIVLDPNLGPCIDNYSIVHSRIYFLHTRFFRLLWHANRDWEKVDPDRFYAELNPETPPIYAWAGNLTLNCCYAQGVLHRTS